MGLRIVNSEQTNSQNGVMAIMSRRGFARPLLYPVTDDFYWRSSLSVGVIC